MCPGASPVPRICDGVNPARDRRDGGDGDGAAVAARRDTTLGGLLVNELQMDDDDDRAQSSMPSSKNLSPEFDIWS